ncbi:MAG: restriction endonuclease subunit S [Mucispirillum sp.]|nr:restriction endonuclease subunit S [Mucispirillum sp.]
MKRIYRLGDIANISAGQGAPQKESDFSDIGKPFIRAGNLAKLIEGYSECNACNLIDDDTAKRYGLRLYPKDTIVFAKSGMSTSKGYVHILSQECYIVNHLACINIYNNDCHYMKYYFIYHKPNKLIKDEAYPSIALADIRDMKINIHNIQTQKEIVAVLDKVTTLISRRKEQLEKLDILVKSKFNEMFGDPVLNPKGWETKKLGEVCDVRDGTHDSPKFIFTGYPLITSKNIINNQLVFDKVNYISQEDYDKINKRSKVDKGDILLPMIGTIGNPVIINIEPNFAIKNVALIKFSNPNITNTYIYNILTSNYIEYVKNILSRGGTQKFIALADIRKLMIPIPPLDLQNQFAEFVEQVEKNKENIKSSLNQLETLYSALMQEYFG